MFALNVKSWISRLTIYQYMIVFLIILILSSAFFYDFGISALTPVLIAIITTTLLDLLIEYFKTKQLIFPQSALISGLFIGGLLAQDLKWHIYVIAGIIAILSKHLIKFQQRHIFNPANLGILLVSFAFHVSHSWWVSSPLILVLIFGIFVIWRLRRIDLALSFLAIYFLISSIFEVYNGNGFSGIYLNLINSGVVYFFSMFMLIEPKTNPAKNRIAYGVLVAIMLVALHFYIPMHDLPLALAIGNILVPFLNKFELKKKEAV
ncbi:RnfABCDGE type electron transport complex subunit D [Candidatus Woesearchaeota archaeon]|nr:RnfABCDGE type electron transport complex subunit D [Candidatus Woesearchaeota archaeon]